MLTAIRRHHHERVVRKAEKQLEAIGGWRGFGIGWHNQRGLGKWYKRRINKAERRLAKMQCRGFKGKEPTGLRGEVNWRGT